MINTQKGQSLVEFALTLPLLFLLLFGIMYSGMLFHDYTTLQGLARSSTREAAIISDASTDGRYYEIENKYEAQIRQITTSLYKPDSTNSYIVEDTDDHTVATTIKMVLYPEASYMIRTIVPDRFTIRYYMRKE